MYRIVGGNNPCGRDEGVAAVASIVHSCLGIYRYICNLLGVAGGVHII